MVHATSACLARRREARIVPAATWISWSRWRPAAPCLTSSRSGSPSRWSWCAAAPCAATDYAVNLNVGGLQGTFSVVATPTNGDNGGTLIEELRKMIEQDFSWDSLDKPVPRTYGPK